jgi:hypothetical protein
MPLHSDVHRNSEQRGRCTLFAKTVTQCMYAEQGIVPQNAQPQSKRKNAPTTLSLTCEKSHSSSLSKKSHPAVAAQKPLTSNSV